MLKIKNTKTPNRDHKKQPNKELYTVQLDQLNNTVLVQIFEGHIFR